MTVNSPGDVSIPPPLRLDAQTIRHCESAVHSTFKTMFNLAPKLVHVVEGQPRPHTRDLTGVIGFFQASAEGAMTIGFPPQTLLPILSTFYGQKMDTLNERVLDSVGEIINVVFGAMKEKYNANGYAFQMCLPVVMIGRNPLFFTSLTEQSLRLNFHTVQGPFMVEVLTLRSIASAKQD